MTNNRFFFDTLQNYNDAIAIITKTGEKLSYRELVIQVNQFSLQLDKTQSLLLIEAVNELPAIIAYLAALRNHHPVIFLPNMGNNNDVNTKVINLYQPNWIYRRDSTGHWGLIQHSRIQHTLHPDLAVLLSTSGSTGTPKLVRLSQKNIQANAQSIAQYLQIVATDKAITALPFHYSYGLSVINSHLLQGASLLLTDESVLDKTFWDFFIAQQGTCFAGVPHSFELLERIDFQTKIAPRLSHLKYFTQAGGRMPVEKVKFWTSWATEKKLKLFVMYGQTEATARMSYLPPELAMDYPEYIGYPIPQGSFSLIDTENQAITESNQPGRLVYQGPNVMMGYALCTGDLAKPNELTELITGDIAYHNEKGLYRIVGRESRFSKIFGLRIDLDAIEHFLLENQLKTIVTGNDEAIAIGVLDGQLSDELLDSLACRLKIPPSIFLVTVLEDVPLLASGKVDYKAVLTQAQAGIASKHQQEEKLADVEPTSFREAFCSALNLKHPPKDEDSFINLGGDSLTYVQVSVAIENFLGYLPLHWEQISLVDLEQHLPKKKSMFADLDMEMLCRVLAITGVVFTHTNAAVLNKLNWHLAGGSNLLLLLAGFNMARFQADKLFSGAILEVLIPFFRKIVLPYYLILLTYQVWYGKFAISSLLLISNYYAPPASFLEPYWFIEMIWQTMLIFSIPFLLPAYRKAIKQRPYLLGLLLFAITFRIKTLNILGSISYWNRAPDQLLYIFLAGWCLYYSKKPWEKIITTVLIFSIFPFLYGLEAGYTLWLVSGSFVILWLPRIKSPNFIYTTVVTISAASFYIYLFHMFPVHIMTTNLHIESIPFIIIMALLTGVLIHKTLTKLKL